MGRVRKLLCIDVNDRGATSVLRMTKYTTATSSCRARKYKHHGRDQSGRTLGTRLLGSGQDRWEGSARSRPREGLAASRQRGIVSLTSVMRLSEGLSAAVKGSTAAVNVGPVLKTALRGHRPDLATRTKLCHKKCRPKGV
eukprot:5250597-Pleurochrysis_carterae.AAC.3